ncbi:MAG: hypothetical protein M3Z02_05055 [Actinomycetota bacterium]|nr:hypothetical protein [Actinomycetota bacterium]
MTGARTTRTGQWGVGLAVLAAVGGGIALGFALAPRQQARYGAAGVSSAAQSAGPTARSQPASVLRVQTTTSVDPAGGTGLQQGPDGHWSTQHYSSASYGGLKPGVGLLLDVSSPQKVSRATVPVDSPGIGLQLFGLDQPATSPAGTPDAEISKATGNVVLTVAASAPHRYWLVWIPRLADDGAGFHAAVGSPTLTG